MKKVILLVVALGVVGGGWTFYAAQRKEGAILVVSPVRAAAVQAVYATGTVEPSVMLPIAPRGAARLMTLMVDEGAHVKKGDVLGQLEDTDIQKQVEELQARADFAGKDYARKAELVKRGVVSKGAADQSRAEVDAARAAVARVKAQLGYLQLIAPEDGVIIRRDGEVGELIQTNEPVFWISCCSPLRVSAEVDEEDIATVKPGQKVLIRADAFPGKIMEGSVTSITPKGDPISRSYRVRVSLPGDTPLMIGMTAETNIVVSETKDAVMVPVSAVQGGFLWVYKDGVFEKRGVETGAKTDDAVEIRSGLSDGEVVAVTFSPELSSAGDGRVQTQDWKP
ncbi:MAG: efflux RND transporter periplasmic adaptor subunit [Alphaproteobacteria bacterium]